jgi:hypothetical protein
VTENRLSGFATARVLALRCRRGGLEFGHADMQRLGELAHCSRVSIVSAFKAGNGDVGDVGQLCKLTLGQHRCGATPDQAGQFDHARNDGSEMHALLNQS